MECNKVHLLLLDCRPEGNIKLFTPLHLSGQITNITKMKEKNIYMFVFQSFVSSFFFSLLANHLTTP